MGLSKNEALRQEIDLLRSRMRTARDEEIMLLTKLIDAERLAEDPRLELCKEREK